MFSPSYLFYVKIWNAQYRSAIENHDWQNAMTSTSTLDICAPILVHYLSKGGVNEVER